MWAARSLDLWILETGRVDGCVPPGSWIFGFWKLGCRWVWAGPDSGFWILETLDAVGLGRRVCARILDLRILETGVRAAGFWILDLWILDSARPHMHLMHMHVSGDGT